MLSQRVSSKVSFTAGAAISSGLVFVGSSTTSLVRLLLGFND
jgi:hypothetical protein